ncbi:craniofacial development protein 2-like [Elysia marginata]|uniref:Craniofacial development protein 2-like n=1 Tax=Elysia marginata TaxID=1093978 RepID=A0AAV4FM22_9GAST|nr:craniofacial development protein 2-like [Elysia marginata]
MVYSGGNEHEKGVGILLDTEHSKSLHGYWPVNERILVVKLSGKPFDIYVIQIYAPTSEHSDDEIEKFYEKLDNVKGNLNTQDVKIVMVDFNAKVGNEKIEDTVGPHGIGDINARGERLVEWCGEHDYSITNTWFRNYPRSFWTWMSPGDRVRTKSILLSPQNAFEM